MSDQRRRGDSRPIKHPTDTPLRHWADHEHPLRWLPRHGEPFCLVEWFTQKVASSLVYLPVYIAIVVTIMLVLIWRLSL